MSDSKLPRLRLPINPSIENLKKQAKRLMRKESALTLQQAQHQLAAQYGCKHWVELLHMVETSNRGATQKIDVRHDVEPLPDASNRSDLAAVKNILEKGSFTQHDLDQALARAVLNFKKRKEIAELLVEYGADPDGQYGGNYGPIVFVTGECHDPDGLQFLIDHGADVTFGPIETKYGLATPMIHTLGSYSRTSNERKHRCIDILLANGAMVPEEVTPPMLAIHRGDTKTLAELLKADPSLVKQTYPTMMSGNMDLRGGSLLHLAVEFCEKECVGTLLDHAADINIQAEIINGIGGQTPVFHTIATNYNAGADVLQYLVDRLGKQIDLSIRGTFRLSDSIQSLPITALEYAEQAIKDDVPEWRRSKQKEIDLLKSLVL